LVFQEIEPLAHIVGKRMLGFGSLITQFSKIDCVRGGQSGEQQTDQENND
jgi:hypothetical protein